MQGGAMARFTTGIDDDLVWDSQSIHGIRPFDYPAFFLTKFESNS
jgi:hypothetical protein